MPLKKGDPRYLRLAVQAANIRFRSTAAARIPQWFEKERVKRSPGTKHAVDARVRALAAKLPREQRVSFFRAYRTQVSGSIRALETAYSIFQKHSTQMQSDDYLIRRKAIVTFRNELRAAIGEETTRDVMKILSPRGITSAIHAPILRSEAEALDVIVNRQKFLYAVTKRILSKRMHGLRLNQETEEMMQDMIPFLMKHYQTFNDKVGIPSDTFLAAHVKYFIQIRGTEYHRKNRGPGKTILKTNSLDRDAEFAQKVKELVDHGEIFRQQRRDLRGLLLRAYATLDDRQQKIVYEYFVSNKTYEEIGKEIGLSKSQVWKIYEQALQRLRKDLGNDAF